MIYAIISLAALGAIFGIVLGIADKKFKVEVDPRIDEISKVLPGANCGGCGFPGCSGYAEAIVAGTAPLNACTAGKDEVREQIAEIMGVEAADAQERKVAQLMCNGGKDRAALLYQYEGVQDCHVAATMFKSPKACSYGCIGLGSCVQSCPFGAITLGPDQLPEIDYRICTGCGACVQNCPQHVLQLVGASKLVHVRCSNKEKGKDAKAACEVACIKCKMCEKNCPQGAITVIAEADGSIARIDYEKCTSCGICVTKCPTNALEIILPINATPIVEKDVNGNTPHQGCTHCGLCQ